MALVIPLDPAGVQGWFAVIGRLHPLVLHVPIGVLVALVVLEILTWFLGLGDTRRARGILAWLAAISALVSLATGYVLSLEDTYPADDVANHRNNAIAFTASLAIAAFGHWRAAGGRDRWAEAIYRLGLVLAAVLAIPTGHLGGNLTHGDGFLTAPLRSEEGGASESGEAASRPESAFERTIHPILVARCAACHGGTEPKAKLSLESPASIRAGGKNGAVLDPKDPSESRLLRRISLGLDEKGHMPPKSKTQLSKEELAALEHWVLAGAPLDGAEAAPESKPATRKASADGAPRAADPKALAALQEKLVHVEAVAAGSPLLWVDFAAPSARLTEAEITALLAPIREQVDSLALNRCKVGDGILEAAAAMPRLRRLELARTEVGDAGLARLSACGRLAELVLTQTKVSDAGVDALLTIPKLEKVYLWGSAVTDAGLARLREGRPGLVVDAGDAKGAAALEVEAAPKLEKGGAEAPAASGPPSNAICPVSGKPVDPKYSIVFEGKVIGFCCPNCPAKFWANPQDYKLK